MANKKNTTVIQGNLAKSAPVALRRNRYFTIFWIGQTLSVLGDAFVTVALPLLVLQATGSVAQMGLVTGTFSVGLIISGFFSGIIVDRVNRRLLMIICDTGRAILYGTIPVIWLLFGPQIWLIYIVVALGAGLGMCFYVAYNAAIPNLVDRNQISAANGRLQASSALSFVIGPVLAGLVSARLGPSVAVGIDALSFAVSAFSLVFIRLRSASKEKLAVDGSTIPPLNVQELLAGIRFLLREPTLKAVSLLFVGISFLLAAALDLFIFHLKHDLGQNDNAVGIVFSLGAIGGVLGGTLASILRKRLGFGVSWLGSLALIGLVSIGIGLTSNVTFIAFLAMGFTFGQTLATVDSMTLRQELTPNHLLGRVTAAYWTLNTAPGPIGALVLTILAAQIGAPIVLVFMGIFALAICFIGIFTPARKRHPGPLVQ